MPQYGLILPLLWSGVNTLMDSCWNFGITLRRIRSGIALLDTRSTNVFSHTTYNFVSCFRRRSPVTMRRQKWDWASYSSEHYYIPWDSGTISERFCATDYFATTGRKVFLPMSTCLRGYFRAVSRYASSRNVGTLQCALGWSWCRPEAFGRRRGSGRGWTIRSNVQRRKTVE